MVQSKNILSLVLLPTLALAGNSFHHRRHAHHQHQQRAVAVSTAVTVETQYIATVTVTYGHEPSEAPKADAVPDLKADAMGDVNAEAAQQGWGQKHGGGGHGRPSSQPPPADPTTAVVSPSPVAPVPSNPAPVSSNPPAEEPSATDVAPAPSSSSKTKTKSSSSAAAIPTPSDTAPPPSTPSSNPIGGGGGSANAQWTPGKFNIQNNCKSDLYMIIDRTTCGSTTKGITISAGSMWTGPIESCEDSHPSYKVSSVEGGGKIVQLEVGRNPTQQIVWENISLIDCVVKGTINGEGIEQCPGAPWYLGAKSTAADPGDCQQFSCQDATSCCKSTLGAYCDPYALANAGEQPVGGCKGATDELAMYASFC